jgi:hypothetical protein
MRSPEPEKLHIHLLITAEDDKQSLYALRKFKSDEIVTTILKGNLAEK